MLIGYARVSTNDQTLHLQEDALRLAGCEEIFTDKISGATADRPGLADLKKHLRKGDTLVIWRLDRLGRSLKNLIEWVAYLEEKGASLKSITESIDTSTPSGKLIFHIFSSLAEFERNLIKERTNAGLSAARARGRLGGRPHSLKTDKKELAIKLYHAKEHTVQKICEMMEISKPTLYSYIRSVEKH